MSFLSADCDCADDFTCDEHWPPRLLFDTVTRATMTAERIANLREISRGDGLSPKSAEECLDEIERLRAALEFYADFNVTNSEGGKHARKALGDGK